MKDDKIPIILVSISGLLINAFCVFVFPPLALPVLICTVLVMILLSLP